MEIYRVTSITIMLNPGLTPLCRTCCLSCQAVLSASCWVPPMPHRWRCMELRREALERQWHLKSIYMAWCQQAKRRCLCARNLSNCYSFPLPVSHCWPVNPATHEQDWPTSSSKQVAPFKHGELSAPHDSAATNTEPCETDVSQMSVFPHDPCMLSMAHQ